jgi:hypothetical protein
LWWPSLATRQRQFGLASKACLDQKKAQLATNHSRPATQRILQRVKCQRPTGLIRLNGERMGLYSNIAKKRARIKAGSGEKMRKPGTKGAPTASAFKAAAKTAKKKAKK